MGSRTRCRIFTADVVPGGRFLPWGLLILGIFGTLGCDNEKPYTPFQVATALPDEPAAPKIDEVEKVAPVVPSAEGETAPPGVSTWKLGDFTLKAPPGLIFSSGLLVGVGDSLEAVAWLLPAKKPGVTSKHTSGLYLFDAEGQPKTQLAEIPSRLPSGTDCSYTTQLQASGEQTLTSTISVRCLEKSLADAPNQNISIIRFAAARPTLLELFVAEPAPGETISVKVNSNDRDGDKQDDIELIVSLTAPSGTQEQLPIKWLWRSAGPSREASAPLTNLARRVSELSTQAIQKAHRKSVPDKVDTLRRLLATMCDELGTGRLSLQGGAKIACGDLWPQLARLVHVKTQAHLGNHELAEALGEVQRANWFSRKLSSKDQTALNQLVTSSLKKKAAKQIARFDVAAKMESGPQRSPLLFSDDGQLWAQLSEGKTKRLTLPGDPPLVVEPARDEENVADDGDAVKAKVIQPPDWTLIPEGPGGRYLAAVVPSCERSEIQLAFARKKGDVLPTQAIDLLAPRPGNCRTFSGVQMRAEVLAWDAGQLAFLLGGQVLFSGGPPKSLTTKVAWGAPWGVVVQNSKEIELWSVEHGVEHHHCVVHPLMQKLACLRGSSVYVFAPSDPVAP